MKNSPSLVSKLAVLASVAFCLTATVPAFAHDGWIEPGAFLVERGQPVWLSLMLGNHSNGHRSYRLAGKWDPRFTRLSVIDPAGQERELTRQLVDLGEDAEKVGPKGPKGFHVAPFTPTAEGLHLVLAEEVKVHKHGEGPGVRTVRIAKSAFGALGAPTVTAAKALSGFDRPSGREDALEIIPLTNLLALMTGDSMTLEVRYKGKPLSGAVVSIMRRLDGPKSAQDLTADGQGRVTLTVGPADLYLARVKRDEAGHKDPHAKSDFACSAHDEGKVAILVERWPRAGRERLRWRLENMINP